MLLFLHSWSSRLSSCFAAHHVDTRLDELKNTTSPDPTVPPPPAAHSKPPSCIHHYCPQANIKLKKLMSNVGLESSVGIVGGKAGLAVWGGLPLQFCLAASLAACFAARSPATIRRTGPYRGVTRRSGADIGGKSRGRAVAGWATDQELRPRHRGRFGPHGATQPT